MLDYFKTNDSRKTSEQEYYIKIEVYTFPDVTQRPRSSIKHEHIYIYNATRMYISTFTTYSHYMLFITCKRCLIFNELNTKLKRH